MGTVDIALLAAFVPAIIWGLMKGLVTQVVSLVSIFISAIMAGRFSQPLADLLQQQMQVAEPRFLYLLAFILVFLTCAIVLSLIGRAVTKLVKIATLGWANRLLGAAFAVFSTAFLLGILISVFEGLNAALGIVDAENLEKLKVYPQFRDFASGIIPQLKVFIGQYIPHQ